MFFTRLVVGLRCCSSAVSCRRSSVVLSGVVCCRFSLPSVRHPNCRGALPPTAFHHGRPVCLLPPAGLLTVSPLSSSRLQLTLPTTVWGVSLAPPSVSASWLPPVGFPSSPSRLLSPPWPSPDFSRLPRSLLFTSCTSFPSPFFVSHTITHTPSSQGLPQFHHKHALSLTHIQWTTFQRKRRGHLKRDSEQGQIDRSILAPLLLALSPSTHTISISPFTILYFIPSSLSFHSHLRQSDD